MTIRNILYPVFCFLVVFMTATGLRAESKSAAVSTAGSITLSPSDLQALWKAPRDRPVVFTTDQITFSCRDVQVFPDDAVIQIGDRPYSVDGILPREGHKTYDCLLERFGVPGINVLENAAFLSLDRADADEVAINGMIRLGNEIYGPDLQTKSALKEGAVFSLLDPARKAPIDCGNEEDKEGGVAKEEQTAIPTAIDESRLDFSQISSRHEGVPLFLMNDDLREGRLALETDSEFLDRFDGTPDPVRAATAYARDAVGMASIATSRDFGIVLKLARLFLYPDEDPWLCSTRWRLLNDVQSYWKGEGWFFEDCLGEGLEPDESRDPRGRGELKRVFVQDQREGAGERVDLFENEGISLVMITSGQDTVFGGKATGPSGFGVFRTSLGNSRSAYGVGVFRPDPSDNGRWPGGRLPQALSGVEKISYLAQGLIYQLFTFTHEMGHIFGSGHSRCYDGLDTCGYEGDGGGCELDEYHGRAGTIMSYCSEVQFTYHPIIGQGVRASVDSLPEEILENNIPLIENHLPVLERMRLTLPEGEIRRGTPFQAEARGFDIDPEDNLVYVWEGCQNTVTATFDERVDCTIPPQSPLPHTVTVTVFDQRGGSDSLSRQIDVVNSPPFLHHNRRIQFQNWDPRLGHLREYRVSLHFSDPDFQPLSLEWQLNGEPAGREVLRPELNDENRWTYPDAVLRIRLSPGDYRVTARVADPQGETVLREEPISFYDTPPALNGIRHVGGMGHSKPRL